MNIEYKEKNFAERRDKRFLAYQNYFNVTKNYKSYLNEKKGDKDNDEIKR